MNEHTVRSYDEDLNRLSGMIAEMGGHAERMLEQSIHALVHSDAPLAQKVISDDVVLDHLQRDVDEKAIMVIAKRQPMAVDLREIVGAIKIAADLERVGDLGKSTAKRVMTISQETRPAGFYRGIEALMELAMQQLKDVLDCYATRDVARMTFIRNRDDEIDAMYTSLFRELLTYMMEDPRNISACTHLLFCAKNIERIGDHATNIAEIVHYVVTGRQMDLDRPKEDKSHVVVVGSDA